MLLCMPAVQVLCQHTAKCLYLDAATLTAGVAAAACTAAAATARSGICVGLDAVLRAGLLHSACCCQQYPQRLLLGSCLGRQQLNAAGGVWLCLLTGVQAQVVALAVVCMCRCVHPVTWVIWFVWRT
jgi:hypothetical protein